MTVSEEVALPKQIPPGGTGMWAPVIPPPRDDEVWVVQAGEDPSIVRGLD